MMLTLDFKHKSSIRTRLLLANSVNSLLEKKLEKYQRYILYTTLAPSPLIHVWT